MKLFGRRPMPAIILIVVINLMLSTRVLAFQQVGTWRVLEGENSDFEGGGADVVQMAADGRLFAGGGFQQAGGQDIKQIAVWDGSNWKGLGAGIEPGSDYGAVFDMEPASDGSMYVGGRFRYVGSIESHGIAKWTGDRWVPLANSLFNQGGDLPTIHTILDDGKGSVYAGGVFKSIDGVEAHGIAHWDGQNWSAVGGGVSGEEDWDSVYSLELGPEGNLFVGGTFTVAGNISVNHIAMWDGSEWHGLGDGLSLDGNPVANVLDLEYDGQYLFAAGTFDVSGDHAVNHVARWNGTSWESLGEGLCHTANALLATGGQLYVSGQFECAGSIEANHIARWDGSTWSSLGEGVSEIAYSLTTDGVDLYAGFAKPSTAGIGNPPRQVAIWRLNDGTKTEYLPGNIGTYIKSIYPNPFKTNLSITLNVSKYEAVRLEIYDVSGRLIDRIRDNILKPGVYDYHWSPEIEDHLSSGVLFIRLVTPTNTMVKSVTYIHLS